MTAASVSFDDWFAITQLYADYASAADSGHFVTFNCGNNRTALTWSIKKNRGRRSSIHSAVIDSGKHDERLSRLNCQCNWQK